MGKIHPFYLKYNDIPFSADILLVFSNVFIFLQDIVMFSGIENHKLTFTSDFYKSTLPLYQLLIIPQAWTLGVELTFYLIAPFILPRKNLIYILLVLSIILRICLISFGFKNDPWTYRFFPTELSFFLLGAISHQILLPLYKKKFQNNLGMISKATTYFLIIFSLFYFLIPLREIFKTPFLFLFFILFLPMTFIFQNKNAIDKWIGDLSYPIYIGHMLVISICSYLFKIMGLEDLRGKSIVYVILSILFAVLLNRYIGNPFEKIRSKFRT